MTHSYLCDISRKQFNKIKPLLESVRKRTRPRSIDLYDIFCGVLYVLKSGCQWRMLPKEYPKWELYYYYLVIWKQKDPLSSESILEKVLKKFGWRDPTKLEKCRRLWKNCERKLNTSLNMVALAFVALLLKRF